MSETELTPAGSPSPRSVSAGNRFARAHHILLYFCCAALVIWLLSGVYQVQADQVAIVERLGQYLTATPGGRAIQIPTGLHYHLPWPIDRVHVISTQQRLTMNVKVFNTSPTEYDDFKREYMNNPDNPFGGNPAVMNAIFNPYLIAADKSVTQMEISVVFRVRDPELWLQAVSHDYHTVYDPNARDDQRNALLQQIAQRAMIAQAARLGFDDLLLEKRETLPGSLQTLLTRGLVIETTDTADPKKAAEIDLGIEVLAVQVTALKPPDAIKPSFDRVLAERVARDTAKANAEAEANGMLAQAKGEKETLRLDALSYRNSAIQTATGEADRFSQVLAQYLNAPDVTVYNMYVDAVTSVTGNAKRIYFGRPGQRIFIEIDPAQYDPNQVKPATGK